jgi:hypothetical protein
VEVLDILKELSGPGVGAPSDAHVVTDGFVVGILFNFAITEDGP